MSYSVMQVMLENVELQPPAAVLQKDLGALEDAPKGARKRPAHAMVA